MMEKLAQASKGAGGTRTPPFTISTITYKVEVYAPAKRADTLPIFLPYMYSAVAQLLQESATVHTVQDCLKTIVD